MSTTLVDNPKAWKTRLEPPGTLEIVTLKKTYVLPWAQFLYAEGGNDEVRIAFATHDVTIKGGGLASLLADLAAQRIAQLHEPSRPDQFENGSMPCIREISVLKIEERR